MFKNKEDFGKMIYELYIDLVLHKTSFSTGVVSLVPVIDQIEHYGLAINIAKRLIKGSRIVTEKGYLLHDIGESAVLPRKSATLEIDENVPGLITLDKILRGEIEDSNIRPIVHIHYEGESGRLNDIKVERGPHKSYLYLPEVREQYELRPKELVNK